jgi:hypothetical protein
MKKFALLAFVCLGMPVTSAYAARMQPPRVNGGPVDVCSGSDCTDVGLFEAARQACIINNQGHKADHWGIEAAPPNSKAWHWTGSAFELDGTGATFTFIDCSGP